MKRVKVKVALKQQEFKAKTKSQKTSINIHKKAQKQSPIRLII